MSVLTGPQAAMLNTVATCVVRLNRMHDGWIIDGRKATGSQVRVIDSLQKKRLVKTVTEHIHINGMNGTKAVYRLVLAQK